MNKYWLYVKKRPALFIGAAVVFGLLLFAVTRGGGAAAGGGGTVVSTGPSEGLQAQAMAINAGIATAQINANSQLAATQISADVEARRGAMELEALTRQLEGQENLAVLSLRGMLAELDNARAISSEQTQASLAALNAQLAFGLAQSEVNAQAGVDMARIAAESSTQQLAINANLQQNIVTQTLSAQRDQAALQTMAFMSAQETAFRQSAMATIPQLKGSTGARVLTEIVNQPRTNFAAMVPNLMVAPPSTNPAVMV